MDSLMQDLRCGIRMLIKRPAFSIVAILALALGMGGSTAIFSLVNTVLFRSLPFNDPDRLVMLWETYSPEGYNTVDVSPPNFVDWRTQSKSFEDMTAFYSWSFNLVTPGSTERVPGAFVSANFFELLGMNPVAGRTFSPGEDQPGRDNVLVLGNDIWKSRFGSDPAIVGRKLTLNSNSYTVIGVAPPGFQFPDVFPERSDLWVPLAFTPEQVSRRDSHSITVLARLKPGTSVAQAQAEMDTIASNLQKQYPDTNNGWGVNLVPLHDQLVGDIKLAVLVLMGAVGFVLLIACANVANLLLARATERRKEVALRAALGASSGRLIRQMLTESILLSVIGGAFGLLLAYWGIYLLVALSPIELPTFLKISIDIPVLIFTLAISLVTGLLFGLAPALQASKVSLNEELKEGGTKASASIHRSRALSVLVVAEIALALVLLISAGLLIRSFIRILNTDPGFKADSLMTMAVSLPPTKYSTKDQQRAFFEQLLTQVHSLPQVQQVAGISTLSLTGVNTGAKFFIEGRTKPAPGEMPVANRREISYEYFSAMGVPLLRGRAFTEQDRNGTPPVMIINQAMARRFWPDEDPIGKRIVLSDEEAPREIVGVGGNEKRAGLDSEPGMEIYVPYLQSPQRFMTLVVRTASAPTQVVSAVRDKLNGLDSELALYSVRTMNQVVADSVAPQRFSVLLITAFAILALFLAAVGIYGVMAYSVSQRTHEIGVRLALGATRSDILRLVVKRGMKLTLIGLVIGLAGAFALTQVLSSLLYGISPVDAITYLGVSLLFTIVALLASFIPARRAIRVDPVIALRSE